MMQEFIEQISKTAKAATDEMHTALPGEIVSFDPGSGMATVQPKTKFKKPNGETMDFPAISGVPVQFPYSKGAAIAFPIKAGDSCMIIFSESALDYWQYGKETDTSLKFDLSNAMCIPGLSAEANDAMQEACGDDAVVIKVGGTTLKVSSDGVTITGKLTVSGEVTGSGVALSTHTHTGDSGGKTSPPG